LSAFSGSFRPFGAVSRGWIVALGLTAAGCSAAGDDGDLVGQAQSASHWQLPSDVRDIGENVSMPYEGAGPWGSSRCGGQLLKGTRALGEYLMGKFNQVSSVGGYACRPNTANTSEMSVHGTGRAMDVFIPMKSGRANSDAGDPVANWLVKNAKDIGVQLIIWNHSVWQANGRNEKAYGGPNPHTDHIHVEIVAKAAREETPFFSHMDEDGGAAANPNGNGNTSDDDGGATNQADAGAGSADAGHDAKADAHVDAKIPPPPPDEPEEEDAAAPSASPTPSNLPAPSTPPEFTPGVDDDSEPGEEDSLGTGVRATPSHAHHEEEAAAADGGCAAAPHSTRSSGAGGAGSAGIALALAAMLRRRRRDS
jgi:hypothetical protein